MSPSELRYLIEQRIRTMRVHIYRVDGGRNDKLMPDDEPDHGGVDYVISLSHEGVSISHKVSALRFQFAQDFDRQLDMMCCHLVQRWAFERYLKKNPQTIRNSPGIGPSSLEEGGC